MSELRFEIIPYGSELYNLTLRLRDEILRRPLGLTLQIHPSDMEHQSIHIAGFWGNELIACVVLKPLSSTKLKLRQMAVASQYQGKGIGTALIKYAEQLAKNLAYNEIELHARLHVADFYAKLGYLPEGDVFEEVTIPHLAFRKQLQ